MGRRKKGKPINGWLIVDKPEGIGSTKVVSKVRWALQARKAGHAGTLDPLATGVLAIALGEATKTTPYAVDALKRYHFTVRWGAATDTDDAEGAVVARSEKRPTQSEIQAILPDFTGEIMQRPPAYSAVKIDGERAYARARAGETPQSKARPIYVDELNFVTAPTPDSAEMSMVCGKGGYVRAIARDLGERLGCLGHITALRRIWAGPFHENQAISFEMLERLRDRDNAEEVLLPVAAGLDDIPALEVDGGAAAQLRQGRAVGLTGAALVRDFVYGESAWASRSGEPVAIGVVKAGVFHPSRVFHFAAD
jgi:tRNA pseudouridine55 synthase